MCIECHLQTFALHIATDELRIKNVFGFSGDRLSEEEVMMLINAADKVKRFSIKIHQKCVI